MDFCQPRKESENSQSSGNPKSQRSSHSHRTSSSRSHSHSSSNKNNKNSQNGHDRISSRRNNNNCRNNLNKNRNPSRSRSRNTRNQSGNKSQINKPQINKPQINISQIEKPQTYEVEYSKLVNNPQLMLMIVTEINGLNDSHKNVDKLTKRLNGNVHTLDRNTKRCWHQGKSNLHGIEELESKLRKLTERHNTLVTNITDKLKNIDSKYNKLQQRVDKNELNIFANSELNEKIESDLNEHKSIYEQDKVKINENFIQRTLQYFAMNMPQNFWDILKLIKLSYFKSNRVFFKFTGNAAKSM